MSRTFTYRRYWTSTESMYMLRRRCVWHPFRKYSYDVYSCDEELTPGQENLVARALELAIADANNVAFIGHIDTDGLIVLDVLYPDKYISPSTLSDVLTAAGIECEQPTTYSLLIKYTH